VEGLLLVVALQTHRKRLGEIPIHRSEGLLPRANGEMIGSSDIASTLRAGNATIRVNTNGEMHEYGDVVQRLLVRVES
jgi:hypothetical protein